MRMGTAPGTYVKMLMPMVYLILWIIVRRYPIPTRWTGTGTALVMNAITVPTMPTGTSGMLTDGIGDVCDGEESRLLENKMVVWGFIGLAIVVIGFLAFSVIRNPPE